MEKLVTSGKSTQITIEHENGYYEDYYLDIVRTPTGRLEQSIRDCEGDHITSFHMDREVTEEECHFFLSGYGEGERKGRELGKHMARVEIILALGIPVDLLYPKRED